MKKNKINLGIIIGSIIVIFVAVLLILAFYKVYSKNNSKSSNSETTNFEGSDSQIDCLDDSSGIDGENQTEIENSEELLYSSPIDNTDISMSAEQIVTVIAPDTSAVVTLWEKTDNGWVEIYQAEGFVGKEGVGPADEYHSYSPQGLFKLNFAFGISNPGTQLEFRQITDNSYWISNVDDPDYNTWQEREYSSSVDEHLIDSLSGAYQYGIVIDYNSACIPENGSAFFFHCNIWEPTEGCVTVPREDMESFMQLIKPGAYILIEKSEENIINY